MSNISQVKNKELYFFTNSFLSLSRKLRLITVLVQIFSIQLMEILKFEG